MGLVIAVGQVAVFRGFQRDLTGDEHVAPGHRVPLLHNRVPQLGLHMDDDAVGLGCDVDKAGLVDLFRDGDGLPHNDLQPGAVEVDAHPGQAVQCQDGLLGRLLAVDGGAVYAGADALLAQLAQNDGGGNLLVARHLDGQHEAGQKGDGAQGQRQTHQKGVPGAEAPQKGGQTAAAHHLKLAVGPLGQPAQHGQKAAPDRQTQRVGVQPLGPPKLHPLLGAEVDQTLGKGAGGGEGHHPQKKVD